MGKNDIVLNSELITEYISEFDDEESKKEDALKWLFENHTDNTDLNCVLIKITALNTLYNAGLNNYLSQKDNKTAIDLVSMAERIVGNPSLNFQLYSDKEEDRLKAFNYIAGEEDERFMRSMSFASKYCSWHNKEQFPIFDSYSRGAIYRIFKTETNGLDGQQITQKDLFNYEDFCQLHKMLRDVVKERFELDYNAKEFDKFLWKCGKKHPEIAIS